MKRRSSSNSLGAMMSLCPNSTDGDDQVNNNTAMYTREFQTAILDGLEEEGCSVDESGSASGLEKKRRLGIDQVKALEKNFEVENKLEPERKLKLAQELGLQPRQVAVWFQNRRARWKTKQLERDYGVLKNSYDELKLDYEKLKRDNEALLIEIKELRSKVASDDGNSEVSLSPKEEEEEEEEEEEIVSDAEEKPHLESAMILEETMKTEDMSEILCGPSMVLVYEFNKDRSYDSDSSAILNEDHHRTNNGRSSPSHQQLLDLHSGAITAANCSMSMNLLQSSSPSSSKESAGVISNGDPNGHIFNDHQIEEHNFFGHEEESCTNLFSDDQAPSLPWYCSEEWN